MYNRFDRGMHPRQSVEDYLSAVKEETQQLEEQLASHKLVRHLKLAEMVHFLSSYQCVALENSSTGAGEKVRERHRESNRL